jgi:hypothetical protein
VDELYQMSLRRSKIPNQTSLRIEGSTFESVALEPFVSLSFRSEGDSPDHKTVLMLVIDIFMHDSSEMTQPTALWNGDSEGIEVLESLIGEVVEGAVAHRDGQIEIRFGNRQSLLFEPTAEGEWRLQRLYRDKVVSSVTWSDGSYITGY